MKPSQFWWMQTLSVAFFMAAVLLPHHEGLQALCEGLLGVTYIFNKAMDRPESDLQKRTSAGIFFALIAALIPFTWGKPMGWVVLALFPFALYSFTMSLRRKLTTQISLPN
jgi:hypothetical protein